MTKGRRKPRFLYWVTLNTHVPVAPGDALPDFHCERGDSAFGTTTVCRMAELWHDFFRTLSTIALDPSVFPADILVVGDHAPQCGPSAAGQVAWYRLSPREKVVVAGNRAEAAGMRR